MKIPRLLLAVPLVAVTALGGVMVAADRAEAKQPTDCANGSCWGLACFYLAGYSCSFGPGGSSLYHYKVREDLADQPDSRSQ